jgi:hypothetical protein
VSSREAVVVSSPRFPGDDHIMPEDDAQLSRDLNEVLAGCDRDADEAFREKLSEFKICRGPHYSIHDGSAR